VEEIPTIGVEPYVNDGLDPDGRLGLDEGARMSERDEVENEERTDAAAGRDGQAESPGDQLRALPAEARERGTRLVSAQAMQARLFSIYDAATAAEDALALVQEQLTLTLDRGYYDAEEIEKMADELDTLLALDALEIPEEDLVAED
jgi:hypothetical protein